MGHPLEKKKDKVIVFDLKLQWATTMYFAFLLGHLI